jgi:hypothetical protein
LDQKNCPGKLLANLYLHYVFDLWADAWRSSVGSVSMMDRNVDTDVEGSTTRVGFSCGRSKSYPPFEQLPTVEWFAAHARQ